MAGSALRGVPSPAFGAAFGEKGVVDGADEMPAHTPHPQPHATGFFEAGGAESGRFAEPHECGERLRRLPDTSGVDARTIYGRCPIVGLRAGRVGEVRPQFTGDGVEGDAGEVLLSGRDIEVFEQVGGERAGQVGHALKPAVEPFTRLGCALQW